MKVQGIASCAALWRKTPATQPPAALLRDKNGTTSIPLAVPSVLGLRLYCEILGRPLLHVRRRWYHPVAI